MPAQLRNQDIATLIPQFLELLAQQQYLESDELTVVVCDWLAGQPLDTYSLAHASELLSKAREFHDELVERRAEFIVKVDFSSTLATLKQR